MFLVLFIVFAEYIMNKDKRDEEELIKKDAFISLYKGKYER